MKLIDGKPASESMFLHLRECHVDSHHRGNKKIHRSRIVSHQMHIYQSKIDFFMRICDDEDAWQSDRAHIRKIKKEYTHTINTNMITQFPQSPISP